MYGTTSSRNNTGDYAQLRIVNCAAGQEIASGGWRQLSRHDLAVRVVQSFPSGATQWHFIFAGPDGVNMNSLSTPLSIQVFAVCVKTS